MVWVVVGLGVLLLVVADRRRRGWYALCDRYGRLVADLNERKLRRRRERTLRWINAWRAAHGRPPLPALRKGVRGSRSYGVIARNLEVFAYDDGVWLDERGGSGGVPDFVARFAREFDDGLFADLAGRLVPVSAVARPTGDRP